MLVVHNQLQAGRTLNLQDIASSPRIATDTALNRQLLEKLKEKKSFSYDGAKVWNSLSADKELVVLRSSDTFTIFKTRLFART